MSDFINTIEVLGDDVLTASIIDKTITEFKDNIITSIGSYAFRNCAALETVVLPGVITVGQQAFTDCSSLAYISLPNVETLSSWVFERCPVKLLDFHRLTNTGLGAFRNAYELTALILRRVDVVCTAAKELFTTSSVANKCPIASGTGYIYVPRALVDSYKAATNWSTFAEQFRALEDYTVDGTITGELDETKI